MLISESSSIIEKEEEYMEYIKNHIQNVKKAFGELLKKIDKFEDKGYTEIVDAIYIIDDEEIIYKHDESKYSDEEFGPYRRHWHSINDQEKEESKEEYEIAWKHHYSVNPHHPEYWIKNNIPEPMELKYIIEMACDWIAMSYTKGGTALQYYLDNKDKKKQVMHQYTIDILEKILYTFYE